MCVLLVALGGAAGMRAQAPSTPATASGALQRGLTLMETRGDCVAALPHFDAAARSTEAVTAARALLLRGHCEERLGRVEDARGTYQRLLRTYPSDPSAATARLRLGRLPTAAPSRLSSPVLRQLKVGPADPSGSVSGNGRYLAYHDSSRTPWRQDLRTNRTEKLTFGPGEWDGARASHLQLSPDGQQVAYAWQRGEGGSELRVMAVPAGTPQMIRADSDLQAIRPVAWSADARRLLVVTTDTAFHVALELIDVATRAAMPLTDLGTVEPFGVTMTGDARWVAFDHAPGPGPRDIRVLDTRTRDVRTLLAQPANDTLPLFLPGGEALLFATDHLGPLSLWRLPFSAGQAAGEPALVRRDVGRIWPIGISPDGTFVHAVQNGLVDVHVARLGADGRLAEQPAPVTATFAGSNISPDWSADGAALTYVAQRGAMAIGPGARTLVVRDHATGVERFLYPDLTFFIQPRWSPDGTRILVKGRSAASNMWGLHMVDARTAALTSVVTAATADAESEIGPIQWVPGREAILIGRQGKAIVEFDLATQAERVIVPLERGVSVTAANGGGYAPDGRTLAWSAREGNGPATQAVLRVREADGAIRDLLRASAPEWLMLQGWAPDGRSLFVVRNGREGARSGHAELWRVPVDGSEPVPTGLSAFGLRGVSVHPDGRTIAYTAGFPTWELWALEGITAER
jgi:Tol biopolymer transport system component